MEGNRQELRVAPGQDIAVYSLLFGRPGFDESGIQSCPKKGRAPSKQPWKSWITAHRRQQDLYHAASINTQMRRLYGRRAVDRKAQQTLEGRLPQAGRPARRWKAETQEREGLGRKMGDMNHGDAILIIHTRPVCL